MLRRRTDWWPRLKSTMDEWDGRPWQWGETDCACFAAACVLAMTDVDPMAGRRGTYASRLQAAARLRWWRHPDAPSAAGEALRGLGCEAIPPNFAMVGDVGATRDGVLAVRMPNGFVARTETGALAGAKVVEAWAVAWPQRVD
jgi:hypothetical protein